MDWFRWFPALYSEATLHLSLEQDAIYRRLIDWYMTSRMPLPCHGIALARICQISLDKWQEHENTIVMFFTKKGDKYHHKRCDIELDRQDNSSKKLSEAARKAHEARKKNKEYQKDISQGNAGAYALPTIEEIEKRREEISIPNGIDNSATNPGEVNHAKPKRRNALVVIPDAWRPNENHRAKCAELGLDPRDQADRFRNHALANDRRCANWNAAFNNWLTSPYQSSAGGKVNGHGHNGQKPKSRAELTAEVIRDMQQHNDNGQGGPVFDDKRLLPA